MDCPFVEGENKQPAQPMKTVRVVLKVFGVGGPYAEFSTG